MAKQTITSFYDTREFADNAAMMLRQAGIPNADITLSPEDATAGATGSYTDTADRPAKGFWASLEDMFGGTEDHDTYAEGLRRGGIMLTAHVDDTKVDDAVRILEQHGSVDLTERETTWRNDGWTGGASLGSAGSVVSADASAVALASTGTTARTTTERTDIGTRAAAPVATAARGGGKDEVFQVVEEQLNVGKRAINRGKVRIHSYVVEKQVAENVTLRDETVTIDRRPVDRALTPGELGADAFKDRTIEMDEIDEEAVVAKTARVVEEIGLRKDVADRVQTVTDSVRSTKVDVEDARTTGGARTALVGDYSTEVTKDMTVMGSDGQHVGIIDHVEGTSLKLKKNDQVSGGQHHMIPMDWVSTVDTDVTLKVTAAEAMRRWTAV